MAERKQLPEDVVEYRLFPDLKGLDLVGNVEKYLEEQIDSYLAFISPFVVDHIWQNEPFSLSVSSDLEGKQRYLNVMNH